MEKIKLTEIEDFFDNNNFVPEDCFNKSTYDKLINITAKLIESQLQIQKETILKNYQTDNSEI